MIINSERKTGLVGRKMGLVRLKMGLDPFETGLVVLRMGPARRHPRIRKAKRPITGPASYDGSIPYLISVRSSLGL